MNELQGNEWLEERAGMVTASRFKDVLAKGKGKTRMSYMLHLADERLMGKPRETYRNAAMERGTRMEPLARVEYEAITDNNVELVGLIKFNSDIACSLDGTVGEDGTIEIKCPDGPEHIATVKGGKLPTKHIPQVQGGLWITRREWCDFVSYRPEWEKGEYFFKVRVYRDEEYIKMLSREIISFSLDLKALVKEMGGK